MLNGGMGGLQGILEPEKAKKGGFRAGCCSSIVILISCFLAQHLFCPFSSGDTGKPLHFFTLTWGVQS